MADGILWVIIVNGFGLTGIAKDLVPVAGSLDPAESDTAAVTVRVSEQFASSPVLGAASLKLSMPDIKPAEFSASPLPAVPVHVYGGIPPIACNEYE